VKILKEKLNSDVSKGDRARLLVLLLITGWTAMFLYFVSSAPLPLILPSYRQQLDAREKILSHSLIDANASNAHALESAQICQLLSLNELCIGDFSAAKKHMQSALSEAGAKLPSYNKNMTNSYLANANLHRDMGEFELAKLSYDQSLHCLDHVAFQSGSDHVDFNAAAINLNNLGVLYFLMGQKAVTLAEKQRYYETARDYFLRVKHLILLTDCRQNQCFRQNLDENLNQCLTELRFFKKHQ
jgi:tetratricopeptide (TPR) repeat protein